MKRVYILKKANTNVFCIKDCITDCILHDYFITEKEALAFIKDLNLKYTVVKK